jgi:membrane protease subunit HflK
MKLDLPEGREFTLSPSVLFGVIVLVLLLVGVITSVYQVNTNEQAVILRFGKCIGVKGSGLHFKLPFGIDRRILVAVKRVDIEEFGIRSGRNREVPEESLMLTGDLNLVRAAWDVQYTRENPEEYLFNVDEPEVTLRDISQSVMREMMGDNASIPILTTGRTEIQRGLREKIQAACTAFNMGIRIDQVNLRFVAPPEPVSKAFNDLNRAEQDAARAFEEASKEYQAAVPLARGSADRAIFEAEGFRQERINSALGEAKRFQEMLKEYRLAPEVTRYRLYLETIERRFPELKEIVIIDEDLKSVLPLLKIKDQ